MAWFRRKTDDSEVLPELEQYYEAERRERAGLSWLLALVSVACVALVIIGLFFSGKWLYGRLTKDSGDATTTVQTEDQNEPAVTTDENTEATPAPSTPVPAPPVTETAKPTPTTPPVVTAPAKLTSTGPEGTLAIFVITTILAAYSHSLILKRKS